MLEQIKQWLAQRRGGVTGDHDTDSLPARKRPATNCWPVPG